MENKDTFTIEVEVPVKLEYMMEPLRNMFEATVLSLESAYKMGTATGKHKAYREYMERD